MKEHYSIKEQYSIDLHHHDAAHAAKIANKAVVDRDWNRAERNFRHGLEAVQKIKRLVGHEKQSMGVVFLEELKAMSKPELTNYMAQLEREGGLRERLVGTKYILSDGSVATITLAAELGLLEPSVNYLCRDWYAEEETA
jgi:hypothetical protein